MTTQKNSQLPFLYSFRRCPYAMRARLAIVYSGVQVALREVVLKDKPDSLRQYSPKATVPVLVIDEEAILEESEDILYWALQKSDPQGLLSSLNEQQQQIVKQLLATNDGVFKTALDQYKYADRFPEMPAEFYRKEGEQFLAVLEQHLENNKFLIGSQLSIADIGIFPFVRQFAFVDKAWFDHSPYKQLQQWLQSMLESSAFILCMEKLPPWEPDQEVVVFPTRES